MRVYERNRSGNSKISETGGREGAPGIRVKIPLQPMMKTTLKQLSPCRPWRSIVDQRSSFGPWKTPLWSKFITKGSFDHVEAFFAGAGLLVAGPVTLQEIHSGEVCP